MLSVIIPARDVGPFIAQAVRSALAQTVRDIEVLLIDDGSRDDTRARIADIADPRLHLLDGQGRGSAHARNQGIAMAKGRYLAFLDADDVWLPDHLARLHAQLELHPELDLVFAASAWIDRAGRPLPRTVVRWQGPISYRALFLEFYPVTTSALLARRSAVEQVGGFDEDLAMGEDHDLCLRLALLRPDNCAGTPTIGLQYRQRPGQKTGNRENKLRSWERLVAKHRRLAPALVPELAVVATANHKRALAALAYENGAYAEARAWITQAWRAAPLAMARDRRTWIVVAAAIASLLPSPARRAAEQLGEQVLGALRRSAPNR